MPLQLPDLDTRTFDQLKRMAQLRIPRYAPDWTDFNESDPGMTLLELFAWLSEMLFNEMNRIPELNYLKLLQLIGMELAPAEPALAYLTFTPEPLTPGGAAASPIVIPRLTQVTAQGSAGVPLIFETTADLPLIRLPLASVQFFDGATFNDVTKANDTRGSAYPPLGWRPQPGCSMYLGFQPPAPAPPGTTSPPDPNLAIYFPEQLRLRAFLPPAVQAANPVACANAGGAAAAPVKIVWEYSRIGRPRWGTLTVERDDSLAFTREGDILLSGPGVDMEARNEGRAEAAMYWVRARLEGVTYPAGVVPLVEFIRPNVVPAENLASINQEWLGFSQGLPDQVYTLRYKPVWQPPAAATAGTNLPPPGGSLVLEVTETEQGEAVTRRWRQVPDFLASGPDDEVFTLDAASGSITFGDGQRGRVPMPQADITACYYRYGGGAAGNVAAGKITGLAQPAGVTVINERKAEGGSDEESLESFKQRAPAHLRHQDRAVTQGDMSALASQVGGVAKAKAVPLSHPDFPGVDVPGAVTIVVVPASAEPQPRPTQALLEQVCTVLDTRRLVTTELFVKEPVYLPVHVEAHLVVQPYASPDKVAIQVKQALNAYLDPLGRIPPDVAGTAGVLDAPGWDFGESFYPTGLYAPILHVSDVLAVTSLAVTINGREQRLDDAALVPPDGLICSAYDHTVVAVPQQMVSVRRPVA